MLSRTKWPVSFFRNGRWDVVLHKRHILRQLSLEALVHIPTKQTMSNLDKGRSANSFWVALFNLGECFQGYTP